MGTENNISNTEKKTIRIIHCADLHLDSKMTSVLPDDRAVTRRNELLGTFSDMADYASGIHATAVLISGDLFDRRRISAGAAGTVLNTIRRHGDVMFIYLTGNHDPDGFGERGGDLPPNLKIISGDEQWTYIELDGGITVAGAALTDENAGRLYASLMLRPEHFNIVMLHGQTREYQVRGAAMIDMQTLRNRAIDYLALGHVHAHRIGRLDARGTWCYPGCLDGRGYDECGNHGFEVIDIDPAGRKADVRFVSASSRMLFEIPVDVTSCMSPVEMAGRTGERLDRFPGAADEEPAGEDGYQIYTRGPESADMVKVVLTGELDIDAVKNSDFISGKFAGAYFDFRVEDRTRARVDYREFEMDASLKGEFVRLTEADEDLTEEQKADVIKCGLQALSGEDFL